MSKSGETVESAAIVLVDTRDTSTPSRKWLECLHDPKYIGDAIPGPPPDGGWLAWRQVIGGFLVIFLCWGFVNSFGLFMVYYSTVLIPDTPSSSISWIGPLQLFLMMFVGAFSGSIADAGYFRATCVAGVFFYVLGCFMMSICTQYWQLLLAHGICTGLGNGLIFIPTLSTAQTYFSPKRRGLAIGIMFCGTAIGGILLPVVFSHVLPKLGFGWTMRVFGFIALAIFAASQVLTRKRLPPKDGISVLDFKALRDKPFSLFVAGAFFNFLGMFFAFFYLSTFGRDVLGLSFSSATDLLLVINGMGMPGRLFPAWLSDQRQWKGVGPLTVQIPMNIIMSIMFFAWIAVKTEGSAYGFATVYGLAAAGLQVIFPAALAEMTTDHRKSGGQMGLGFTICSFACLLGNPIGGLILRASAGKYVYAQIYGGVCLFIGSIITMAAAWSKHRRRN